MRIRNANRRAAARLAADARESSTGWVAVAVLLCHDGERAVIESWGLRLAAALPNHSALFGLVPPRQPRVPLTNVPVDGKFVQNCMDWVHGCIMETNREYSCNATDNERVAIYRLTHVLSR
eukprot:365544-Chlamydomonas_euryale.AAC.2